MRATKTVNSSRWSIYARLEPCLLLRVVISARALIRLYFFFVSASPVLQKTIFWNAYFRDNLLQLGSFSASRKNCEGQRFRSPNDGHYEGGKKLSSVPA